MRKKALDEANRWISQASEDLKWAKHLAHEGGYHVACFLAQQVAEKAIKAFLYAQGEEIVLGHSVSRLSNAASQYHEEFLDKSKKWGILDTFYIPTRYPNGLPDGIPADVYNHETAETAVQLAEEAVNFVQTFFKIKEE